ncbi:MAG: SprT-like domain-containing protein [bacterium]
MQHKLIRGELERRILHGIACEWNTALAFLDPHERNHIRMPLFSLTDREGAWGDWSRERREISLSRKLVLHHPWDSVREVLHHEMAHQYADEVLGAFNEPPHGPCFQQACHLLRANPKASGNYPPLRERVLSTMACEEDRFLVKVKKLLALAESGNPHEAEAALAKAHELIARYNLGHVLHDGARHFVSIFVGEPALRHSRADYLLARILQEFYFVNGIWVPAYVLGKGKMGRALEISGTLKNTHMASYVYDFVRHFIDARWREYTRKQGVNHARSIDFAVGVLEGFRARLSARKGLKRPHRTKPGLIRREDPLLVAYCRVRYPTTRTFSRRIHTRDEAVLKEGKRIGKNLVIAEGIKERVSPQGLLNGS